MADFYRFWNLPRRWPNYRRASRWEGPANHSTAPGHIFDLKENQVGGFRRFDRFQKLPVKAQRLYWRHHKARGYDRVPNNGYTPPSKSFHMASRKWPRPYRREAQKHDFSSNF